MKAETEANIIEVVAKLGQKNRLISRLKSGKIVLFSEVDPCTADVNPGDSVRCEVIKETETYILVKPLEVTAQAVAFTDESAALTKTSLGYALFLSKECTRINLKLLQGHEGSRFTVRASIQQEEG